ncbi:xre family transcriptional regulator : : HTH_3 [Gemmata massiliana]|uniref:Xre family transcriptional regulator:: HTH_3 n=1 Tax=Gemmata massiliana TaxID=1210884 RepID=A0A6P2CUA6_9BACT|nr:xre family transcriptional regulator : : HTH_3 [Gemmata massiliana]
MTFQDKLKELLQAKNWNSKDLADHSGIPYPTCKSYFLKDPNKRRLPSYGHAVLICAALGTSLDTFKDCDEFRSDSTGSPSQ